MPHALVLTLTLTRTRTHFMSRPDRCWQEEEQKCALDEQMQQLKKELASAAKAKADLDEKNVGHLYHATRKCTCITHIVQDSHTYPSRKSFSKRKRRGASKR